MEDKLVNLLLLLIAFDSAVFAASNFSRFQHSCDSDRNKLVDARVKLTVALGILGRLKEARAELRRLSNYEKHIGTVVTQLYDGDNTNIKRTIDIFWKSSCGGVAKGSAVLLDEMKRLDHLSKPEMLVFQKFLQDIGCEDEIKATSFMVEHYADKILSQWSEDVKARNCTHIFTFIRASTSNYAAVFPHISELVKRGFNGKVSSFSAVLEFINDSPYLEIKAPGYMRITQELKKYDREHSKNMLLVGYWVHSKMKNNAQTLKENKHLFEAFGKAKAEIPSVIQNLFWKPTCTIKNLHWMEYMYATNESRGNQQNGAVFTWMPGNRPKAAKWILESKYSQGKVHFFLINKHLSSKNSSSNGMFNLCQVAPSLKVGTCASNTSFSHQWFLEPTTITTMRWNGDAFRMKSVQESARYYLSQENADYHLGLKRREVQVSGILGESSFWDIECS